MTNPAAMDTYFGEQADAAAWLVKRIAAAIEEAEEHGRKESATDEDRRAGSP